MSAPETKRRRLEDESETEVEKTVGEQMADLLRRHPKNYDVTFSVGPEQIKVKAVKFVLKAVSPVFEKEFDEKWEFLKLSEGEEVPLPDVDPTSFKLFVNLLILDEWSLDSIKALKLSSNNLLSLLWLCRYYEITKAIKKLEKAAEDFIQSFDAYAQELLEISRQNLEIIFASETIPLDEKEILECACRWANNQCRLKELEPTGENYRKVLGGCLFEIRFPTMSNQEFTAISPIKKGLLKDEEKVAIYEYIGLNAEQRTKFDKTRLQFKTAPRVRGELFGYCILSLPQQYRPTTSPLFVCDGSRASVVLQVSQKISLHKIGFLGPIDEDTHTHFDAAVQISGRVDDSGGRLVSRKYTKTLFVQRGKTFYFTLDEPFILQHSAPDWKSTFYTIDFWLKGTKNISQYKVDNPKNESIQVAGVDFVLNPFWTDGNPLAELCFKKV